jgi:hypothetical protein
MGKHETGLNVMPAHNIGEGSEPKGSVTRPLRADSRERPALIHFLIALNYIGGSREVRGDSRIAALSLLALNGEVSRAN